MKLFRRGHAHSHIIVSIGHLHRLNWHNIGGGGGGGVLRKQCLLLLYYILYNIMTLYS